LRRTSCRALDVGLDDAAVRARAVDGPNIDPAFTREPPRQGRSKDAVSSIPPDLRGDFVHDLFGCRLFARYRL